MPFLDPWDPAAQEIERLSREVNRQQTEIEDLHRRISDLECLETRLREAEQRVADLKVESPSGPEPTD